MSRLMLSVSGCRGVLGETMTLPVAARFAGAFGRYLRRAGAGAPVVVVGRDGRRGSAEMQAGAMHGLADAGCRVLDIGVAATPTVAVMVDEVRRRASNLRAAGLVITASHNPQEWCGLKCLVAGDGDVSACAPPADAAGEIIALFEGAGGEKAPRDAPFRPESPGEFLGDHSAAEVHVARVLRALTTIGIESPESLGEGLRVALDSVNASGAEAGRLLLESLGCEEVIHVGAETSGVFPHPPEPTAENLSLPGGLCDVVRENGCDVGFAQDPDADRLAIIDERARYIGEEYTLALGAMALLEAPRPGGATTRQGRGADADDGALLVTNLSTSRMLNDVAARHGARVVRTPVGEAHVVAEMKRAGSRALCGGEGNGGLIWPRVAYVRDSLSAMALTLALLAGRGRALSELVRDLPAYAIAKRKVSLPRREEGALAVERIAGAFALQRIDRRDGVWVDFTSGPYAGRAWLHVRASNTEPVLRLIAEAPTPAAASAILDQAAQVVGG